MFVIFQSYTYSIENLIFPYIGPSYYLVILNYVFL